MENVKKVTTACTVDLGGMRHCNLWEGKACDYHVDVPEGVDGYCEYCCGSDYECFNEKAWPENQEGKDDEYGV